MPSRCSWTDLGPLSCRHHIPESPMSLWFHLPRLQQKQTLWHKPSEHSWADLGLWSCHRHNLDHPVSQHVHLQKSQRQHGMWHKSASIQEILELLPVTTMVWTAPRRKCQTRSNSKAQPSEIVIAWRPHVTTVPSAKSAVQQHTGCLHFEAQKVEESLLDLKDFHKGRLQRFGTLSDRATPQDAANDLEVASTSPPVDYSPLLHNPPSN